MNQGTFLLLMGPSLLIAGCGGGSSASPGVGGNQNPPAGSNGSPQAPITVVGKIDAFGSIFVNGIEFETDSAEREVDDEDAFDDSALSVGMVVKVKGTASDDGRGSATRVYYDDELEGPVANLVIDPTDDSRKTFTVLGESVSVESGRTVFRAEDDANFSFDTLADGDHVEVSGEYHDGTLWATYIKKEDDQDDDFEARGTVSAFDGIDRFTLTLAGGTDLDVTVAPGAERPGAGISDGQFVEVEGTIPDPVNEPTAFRATKVELEDRRDFDDDDDEVEVEGMLSFDEGIWTVRSNELAFDDNTEYRPASLADQIADGSADGRRVEVKGQFTDGVLHVDRIKFEGAGDGNNNDLEIKGVVESVDPVNASRNGTVVVSFSPAIGTIAVIVNEDTTLLNDDSRSPFELSNLIPGSSFVEIHGYLDDGGNFVASAFELEDGFDEYEVEGPLDVDGFSSGSSISVLGVTFFVDANTQYEDGLPSNGDIVDVEDTNRDGTAESVDVED